MVNHKQISAQKERKKERMQGRGHAGRLVFYLPTLQLQMLPEVSFKIKNICLSTDWYAPPAGANLC
jgi:hypothetical protein